ncbi:MAG: hypothetical protein A2178_01460 [Planctomycetes bacterium GWC2_49_10]|nr:MAG: hypothetical protein A2178_01460 [Planctomycetes bacterium GWC2_49_10]
MDAGWNIPWGIAIVGRTAEDPAQTATAEARWAAIRAGHYQVLESVANTFLGANTDELGWEWRSPEDKVHFYWDGVNGYDGLTEHARRWKDRILEWMLIDVNMNTFGMVANMWEHNNCGACSGADLNGDGNVNVYDLAKLCGLWLNGSY